MKAHMDLMKILMRRNKTKNDNIKIYKIEYMKINLLNLKKLPFLHNTKLKSIV